MLRFILRYALIILDYTRAPSSVRLRLGSHCSAYKRICICFCRYLSMVHTALFLHKNADENIHFCGLTLLTIREQKISFAVV